MNGAPSLVVSVAPTNQSAEATILTLGELLYAAPEMTFVSEKEWLAALRAIAAGDEAALRVLYERASPVVFTYLMRLTRDRYLTDTLLVEVFQMVWCEAPLFDTADGPVLGWIMRLARSLALARMDIGKSLPSDAELCRIEGTPSDATAAVGVDARRSAAQPVLQSALETLTKDEREAIEAAFLDGLSFAACAAKIGQPIGTIKSRIRSGLAKLQGALHARGEEA